jgi:hypothetical protein
MTTETRIRLLMDLLHAARQGGYQWMILPICRELMSELRVPVETTKKVKR